MFGAHHQNAISVLDGGLATELERNGFYLLHDALWSARILYQDPAAIIKVHESYLNNGANIITTASYQASLPGFEKHLNLTFSEGRDLIKKSVELAKEARRNHCNITDEAEILIAGSVGPYGAVQADGSEYSGDYCEKMSHEDLSYWHRDRIECLLEAGADLLAFETIPAVKEAEALLMLLGAFPNAKAWLSFSCQSPHQTCHKENMCDATRSCMQLAASSQLLALGINCCPPQYAEDLLKDISSVCPRLPLIVYPNSGESWDTDIGWSGSRPKPFCDYVKSWIQSSAKIIGGCCRTTCEDILDINEIVQKIKHSE